MPTGSEKKKGTTKFMTEQKAKARRRSSTRAPAAVLDAAAAAAAAREERTRRLAIEGKRAKDHAKRQQRRAEQEREIALLREALRKEAELSQVLEQRLAAAGLGEDELAFLAGIEDAAAAAAGGEEEAGGDDDDAGEEGWITADEEWPTDFSTAVGLGGDPSDSSGSDREDADDARWARGEEIRRAIVKGWYPVHTPGKPQNISFKDLENPGNIIEGIPVPVTTDKYDTFTDEKKEEINSKNIEIAAARAAAHSQHLRLRGGSKRRKSKRRKSKRKSKIRRKTKRRSSKRKRTRRKRSTRRKKH